MLEQLSATIDKVYGAAAGTIRWKDALLSIEELTGSTGAVLDMAPTCADAERRTIAGSFSDDNCAEYARDYQAICPRIAHALQHPEQNTQFDYLFMTEAEMDRDPVYHWFGSHGLRYYIGAPAGQTPNYFAFVSLQRSRRQGHATEADLSLFQLLQPHLSRAVGLADQLGTLRSYKAFGSAIFEALPMAVFALGENGRVLFANPAGRALVSRGDGIRIEAGRLIAGRPDDQSRMDALIREATNVFCRSPQSWTRVSRPSGGQPYALFVAPLPVTEDELTASGAKVLLLVHDIASHRSASVEMLIRVYGLTDTEARLASALSGGHSLESAAKLLRMQPATARSHLKAVFRKMEIGRQQDLVRVLASISTVSGMTG